MRVHRPKYTDKRTGKRTPSPNCHVRFKDHRGEWRRLTAFSDKGASEKLGRRLQKLVALRAVGATPDEDMARWLEGVLPEHREKLRAWGILDESIRALTDPLDEHVDDYHAHVVAKGSTREHADLQRARIFKVLRGCGFVYWSDIHGGTVSQWLSDQRDASKMSTRTNNFHLVAIKSFCRWMADDGRAGTAPLRRLKAVPVTDEQERGVFTVEQVRRLIDKTAKSKNVRSRMEGPTRALLYRLAVETGLRAGAIASLTRDSFKFSDDGRAVVTVEAGNQKNRRKHRVPVRTSLAVDLRPLLARTRAGRPLFNLKRGAGAGLLRDDLADAGLPEYDGEGNKLVFHSFRHTAGTWLCEHGVDLKVVQEVLGHRTFAMTADRYTHTRLERVAAEMAKLPELMATGTGEVACQGLAQMVSDDGQSCPTMAIDTPHDDTENAFLTRWGGRVVEGAGLENR